LFQVIIIYLIKHVYNYILLRLQLFHNHCFCFITLKTNYYRSGSSLLLSCEKARRKIIELHCFFLLFRKVELVIQYIFVLNSEIWSNSMFLQK
jgi:hypothetical protein